MRRFLQGLVVRACQEHGIPAPGGDLDRVRSSLTCSMSGNRFFRASLAVMAIDDLLRHWYQTLHQFRVPGYALLTARATG